MPLLKSAGVRIRERHFFFRIALTCAPVGASEKSESAFRDKPQSALSAIAELLVAGDALDRLAWKPQCRRTFAKAPKGILSIRPRTLPFYVQTGLRGVNRGCLGMRSAMRARLMVKAWSVGV